MLLKGATTLAMFKRDNNRRVREAMRNKTKVYTLVRGSDRWVHSEDFWRVNIYSEREVKSRKSVSPHWEWVEVDPADPTAKFIPDERGTFWFL